MVVVGDARERGHRLALAARAEDHHLARRQLHRLLRLDQNVLRHVEVAELPGDVEVLAHRAADDRDLAADLDGDVDRLLHPVDVRREGDDEDPALAKRDQRAKRFSDEPLGAGHPRPLGVRRVAEHQVDAEVPELRQPADVGLEAVDGRVVELPVARVDDPAGRRLENDRDAVRNRVRHADEVQRERADLDLLPGLGLLQLRRRSQAMLVELRLDQAERQLRRDHLVAVHLAEQVWQPTDVVFVPVREDDGVDAAVAQVADVRQNEVDAKMLVPGEREARVDDDDLVAVLVDRHVLADLAEAAQRDDSKAHAPECTRGYLGDGRLEEPEPREAVANAVALVVGRLDERQPVPADLVAEQIQRGLDRDRVADDSQELDRGE